MRIPKMPGKNIIKPFYADGYYHIYNRGVEKRKIYMSRDDYILFLWLIKQILSDEKNSLLGAHKLFLEIKLLAFCLMPNHFHLLLWQKNKNSITKFMRLLMTCYSNYFNEKYDRVGSLFQGIYRGVVIKTDEQLVHASRYIHNNPREIGKDPFSYPYSSLPNYLGVICQEWLDTEIILNFYRTVRNQSNLPKKYRFFLGNNRYNRINTLKDIE